MSVPRQTAGCSAEWITEISEAVESSPGFDAVTLALALALDTGQRRSDLVLFGKQHVQKGWLVFTQQKGKGRNPVRLEIPIVTELEQIIEASETGDLAFVVNAYGRPFTNAGFGNRFRKWCDEAELGHCSDHGLRKAAAARLAELGCCLNENPGSRAIRELLPGTPNMPGSSGRPGRFGGGLIRAGQ